MTLVGGISAPDCKDISYARLGELKVGSGLR
jgi:hypothetical protein